jgi:hypothetical protein
MEDGSGPQWMLLELPLPLPSPELLLLKLRLCMIRVDENDHPPTLQASCCPLYQILVCTPHRTVRTFWVCDSYLHIYWMESPLYDRISETTLQLARSYSAP